MLRLRSNLLLCLSLLVVITACNQEEAPENKEVNGLVPIYASEENISEYVQFKSARSIEEAGRIYVYQNYLLVNEVGEGLHIYNNENPASPQKIGFLEIPGNTDLSIQSNILYANLNEYLVIIDVSDINAPQVVGFSNDLNQNQHAFPHGADYSLLKSEGGKVYYECPDKTKGVIVDWREGKISNPQCYIY